MKTLKLKKLNTSLLLVVIALSLTACGIASEVVNHEANDRRLLKPGALDVPINEIYSKYQYNFLDKYKISHDFIMAKGCSYRGKPVGIKDVIPGTNYAISPVLDVFEKYNHTYQRAYMINDVAKLNPMSMDKYTRSEWQNGTDSNGNPMIATGFNPICFESWGGTSHTLVVKLYKQDVATWHQKLTKANPDGKFKEETIGGNKWLVQTNPVAERRINSTGGAFLHYTTAIADTGYTLTMQLGANQDSLQHPQAHAQMQAIFKHLIESVKIEPIK